MELKESRFDRLLNRESRVDHLMRQDQPESACGDVLVQSLVTRNALSKAGLGNNERGISFLNSVELWLDQSLSTPTRRDHRPGDEYPNSCARFRQQFQGESFLFYAEIVIPQPLPRRSVVEVMG
jgi:hypothetical protein